MDNIKRLNSRIDKRIGKYRRIKRVYKIVQLHIINYNRYIELNNEIGYVYKTIKEHGKVLLWNVESWLEGQNSVSSALSVLKIPILIRLHSRPFA